MVFVGNNCALLLLCVAMACCETLVVHLKDYKDDISLAIHVKDYNATCQCIFSDVNRREDYPHLASIYMVHVATRSLRKELQNRLLSLDIIDAAYIKPAAKPPVMMDLRVNKTRSDTPLFEPLQGYLDAPPYGMGVRYMWNIPGGRGEGITIVDVEGGWTFDHEDLIQHDSKLITGVNQLGTEYWEPHGTAVFGMYGGYLNDFGVTGIASKARIDAASIFQEDGQENMPKAIIDAADYMNPGDIMLAELHEMGPNNDWITIEWFPDNYAALKYATDKGIIVVQTAGNGNQNFDDPIYDRPLPGFPPSWSNPFKRNPDDSGCILNGAGAPPSGNYGPPNSRLEFSNYGSAMDVQGWGREVVTTGLGDLQDGPKTVQYTAVFAGTSSSAPMVVGALACIQGALKAANLPVLTPLEAREALRNTGSRQQPAPGRPVSQRIGSLPNVEELWDYARSLKLQQ